MNGLKILNTQFHHPKYLLDQGTLPAYPYHQYDLKKGPRMGPTLVPHLCPIWDFSPHLTSNMCACPGSEDPYQFFLLKL